MVRSRHCRAPGSDRGTFRHDRGTPRDGVGEVEIIDARLQWRLVRCAAQRGELLDIAGIARRYFAKPQQMWMGLENCLAQLTKGIVRQFLA